ncbi:MAG: hypothetical protein HKN13_10245 [Rhodothermales bacterium]|nr:hypothetical protein [Rhodothermales bacterium]
MESGKLLRTALIVVIAIAAISGTTDSVSERYAEQALTRALATFTVARTLNGVISVAQGTEVAVEPGGVGVILTPGQVLDPVNDLIERFSSVMLIAASSLGLQLVLLKITSSWVVTALLIAALCVWLATVWMQGIQGNRYVAMALRFSLMLVFVRFAIPVVIICTNFLFSAFLQEDQESATAALEGTSVKIEEINTNFDSQTSADSASESADIPSRIKRSTQEWLSGVGDWFGSIGVSAKMEQLKENASAATSHIVNLIAIFVLQTILFPLVFLWIFVEILKNAATQSISRIGTGS